MTKYKAKNLSVLAYANGFTFWHYKTEEESIDVCQDDYFELMNDGDMIIINAKTEGVFSTGLFVVSVNDGAHVLTSMLNIGGNNAG